MAAGHGLMPDDGFETAAMDFCRRLAKQNGGQTIGSWNRTGLIASRICFTTVVPQIGARLVPAAQIYLDKDEVA